VSPAGNEAGSSHSRAVDHRLTIDVAWVPSEIVWAAPPRSAVVIDVIRATTSIATALHVGARRVLTTSTVEKARGLAEGRGALLAGERGGLPPDGFDFGNSPGSFTPERVAGREIVFSTTNGTSAVDRVVATGASDVWLAAFRTLGAVERALSGRLSAAADDDGDEAVLAIVCAGRGGHVSLDDAWCAGHLVSRLVSRHRHAGLTDGARTALELAGALGSPTAGRLRETSAGRAIVGVGLEDDLAVCARMDDLDVAPVLVDGAFVTGGEEAGT
jgi:2-phosphosulfolactate phosphatase